MQSPLHPDFLPGERIRIRSFGFDFYLARYYIIRFPNGGFGYCVAPLLLQIKRQPTHHK